MNNYESTKKKISFSIVDLVIILVIVALIVGIVARYDVVNKLFSKTTLSDAKVTFAAESLTEAQVKALKEGTQFYSNDKLFGTLHTVSSEKTLIYSEGADGTLVSSESSELFDVSGSFIIKVTKTDSGYLLGAKQYIAPGSQFVIKANGAAICITIISLNETN
jgi:hypothetical protein